MDGLAGSRIVQRAVGATIEAYDGPVPRLDAAPQLEATVPCRQRLEVGLLPRLAGLGSDSRVDDPPPASLTRSRRSNQCEVAFLFAPDMGARSLE